MMMSFFRVTATLVIALCVLSSAATAQSTVPVTLLLKENFGRPDINAIVRVDGRKFPRPVIALKRSALTPELLLAAVSALSGMRQKFGEPANRYFNVEITSQTHFRSAKSTDAVWARGILASLEAQAERNVPNIGRAREFVVALPMNR